MPDLAATYAPGTPPPALFGLFLGFLSVGICGFGGALRWARRMVAEQRRWLTSSEFTDLLGLCQFLPGPSLRPDGVIAIDPGPWELVLCAVVSGGDFPKKTAD